MTTAIKNLYDELHLDPKESADFLKIERTETLVPVVNDRIELTVPAECRTKFHPTTLEMLARFNTLDIALQKAILVCAKRVEASLPPVVKNILVDSVGAIGAHIRVVDGWTGSDEQKSSMLKYAHCAVRYHATLTVPVQKELVEADLESRGVIVNWSAISALPKNPGPDIWKAETVRNMAFCLIDLKSNLPILQKSFFFDTVSNYGSYWRLRGDLRVLNETGTHSGSFGPSGSKTGIDPDNFRLPHFLEIVAILSCVRSVDHLPADRALAKLPVS